jgi:hypothetical protein
MASYAEQVVRGIEERMYSGVHILGGFFWGRNPTAPKPLVGPRYPPLSPAFKTDPGPPGGRKEPKLSPVRNWLTIGVSRPELQRVMKAGQKMSSGRLRW